VSGLGWGLLGAMLIGASDCTARVTSQRVSLIPLIFCVMAISTLVLSITLFLGDQLPIWHTRAWLASAISGALNIVALYLLYKALSYGPVAVASPVASSFAIFLVVLNVLAGEPWTGFQVLAVIMVFAGVAMLSIKSDESLDQAHHYTGHWLKRTSLLALGAAIAIACRMFFAQEATAVLGATSALYLNRLFALISCSIVLLAIPLVNHRGAGSSAETTNRWPVGRLKWLVLLQATLEMLALAAFLNGSEGAGRVAATIGFSTFAAATTLIAWLVLKEPIGKWQGMWIVFISIGVMIASVS